MTISYPFSYRIKINHEEEDVGRSKFKILSKKLKTLANLNYSVPHKIGGMKKEKSCDLYDPFEHSKGKFIIFLFTDVLKYTNSELH